MSSGDTQKSSGVDNTRRCRCGLEAAELRQGVERAMNSCDADGDDGALRAALVLVLDRVDAGETLEVETKMLAEANLLERARVLIEMMVNGGWDIPKAHELLDDLRVWSAS